MADEPTKPSAPAFEVEISRPTSTSSDPTTGQSATKGLDSASVDFDVSGGVGPEDHEDEPEGDLLETPEDKEPEADDEPDANALPEYDASNEEVKQKYDERFFTKDGAVNMETLSAEYFANEAKGVDGLNAGTYAYLKDTLGLTQEAIKQVEVGQKALREKAADGFYKTVDGGKEAFEAAIAWGRDGGYTKAQQDAFNKALTTGGEVLADATEALMARFKKATGGASPQRRGPPQRRPSSPQRDVTGGARAESGAPAGERFDTQADFQTAWASALDQEAKAKREGDPAAKRAARDNIEAIRRKARRGYRKG